MSSWEEEGVDTSVNFLCRVDGLSCTSGTSTGDLGSFGVPSFDIHVTIESFLFSSGIILFGIRFSFNVIHLHFGKITKDFNRR